MVSEAAQPGKQKSTYYAITSTNPNSPSIVCSGGTVTEAREAAEAVLALDATSDIYAITRANNMRVWSRSAAIRRFGRRAVEVMEEVWVENEAASAFGPGPEDEVGER
jgi:hypothetical protein